MGVIFKSEREMGELHRRALRNGRRAWRSLDTQGEKMERWLDRMIARKTWITYNQALPLDPMWKEFKARVNATEKAFLDFFGTFY